MKQKTINIYEFKELSKESKEKAISQYKEMAEKVIRKFFRQTKHYKV